MNKNLNIKNTCKIQISDLVGLILQNGIPKIYFPRGYQLSDDINNLRKDIITLISVLEKYKIRKKTNSFIDEKENLLKGFGDKFQIKTYIWLIQNYIHNGIYKEYKKLYKRNKTGKINWSKTLKTYIPYNINNNFIYLDFIVEEKRSSVDNIISQIHKYAVEKSIENIGWLFNGIYMPKGNVLPFSKKKCVHLLQKELTLTNIDYKKQLLQYLLEFFKGNDDIDITTTFKSLATYKFENVWEDMLRVVFGNMDEKSYYSRGYWYLNTYNQTIKCSELQPDIILRDNNEVFVLDAKFYRYGITGNPSHLPQSSDITKQFYYSASIKNNVSLGVEKIYDVFLLPFESNNNNIFKYIGYATASK